MEEIHRIGLAYFANLSCEDRKLADKFFNKMFRSRGEIGFDEYVEFVRSEGLSPKIANKDCFKVLDVDNNGSLNRKEAKPLYYISESKIIYCDKCEVLLTGSFFSCFQCFSGPSRDTFDLCCHCYKARKFQHHDDAIFYDNQNLLFNHKERSHQGKKNELQLTAEAYYKNAPQKIKEKARKFFKEMDKEKNEEIALDAYISYMKQQGYEKMANSKFFSKLNGSGSGKLDRMEVRTLYYVIQSRRPFCDCCDVFMDGVFFTCYECFNGGTDKTFHVCTSCFKSTNHKQKHKQHKHFVDNYTLLESKRIDALMEKKGQGRNEITIYKEPHAQRRPSTSTSTAAIPQNHHQQINLWLSFASSLTGIGAGVASIITGCSIM